MDFFKLIGEFFRDEEGASVVEYGVLIALIIAACIAIIIALGLKVETAFNDFSKKLDNAVQ